MEANIQTFLPYLITILKAVVIAVVGYIVAVIGKKIILKATSGIDFFKEQKGLPESSANMVYYLILLITVVAVLEALGLKYVTQPILDLLNKVASYIPNIVGAVVILVVGIFFAKIAKEFTNSLVETFRIEELGKKYGIEDLGGALGNFVYLFILLFVVIAALNALQIQSITEPAVSMLSAILTAIPKIAAAVLVFGIIFYVGKVIGEITANIVDEINLDEIAKEIGISSDKFKFKDLIRYLILTFAVLLGLSQAFHYLNAQVLYQLTENFTVIAFKLTVAAIIVFVGTYLGNQFEKRVSNETLGKTLKWAFITASVIIALPYVGVSPQIIEVVVLSLSLGVGLAFALAFGLGGKEIAARILEKWVDKKDKGGS